MNGKSINFDDKKINKSSFYINKKLFNIYDLDVNEILIFKKNHLVQNIHLNTSLDIKPFLIMNLIMKSLIMNLLMINLKVKIVF